MGASILSCLLSCKEVAGVFKVNGQIAGIISEEQQTIALPLPQACELLLEFIPFYSPQGTYLPLSRNVRFEKGKVEPSDCSSTDGLCFLHWPGLMIEIEVHPHLIVKSCESMPKVAGQHRFRFAHAQKHCHAVALLAEQLYVIIEDADTLQPLYNCSLQDCRGDCTFFTAFFDDDLGDCLVLTGKTVTGGEFVCVFAQKDDAVSQIFFETGDEIEVLTESSQIRILSDEKDIVGHGKQRIFTILRHEAELTFQKILLQKNPTWPQSKEDTLQAFFEALALANIDEALQYLSHNLRQQLSATDLKGFFGDFQRICDYRYGISCAGLPIGLVYEKSPHSAEVKLFYAELIEENSMQGPYKIDNIAEA